MNSKQKAKELFRKMYYQEWMEHHHAKHCALVAVGEILSLKEHLDSYKYWQEVRTEIEKL